MQIHFLIALCSISFLSKEAFAESENEVKRGVFPFMAFLYYPDETVVDSTGARFLHGAVLIRPDWLISSAIDHSVLDNIQLGFPRKTLLARAGSIAIDANLALNEDEDEQEREIIKIVRPSIHNVEVWWFTDITLLKTLLPFNLTSAVSFTSINNKRNYDDKNCMILVFARKYGNITEEKILMQLTVEMLPASIEQCGNHFSQSSMACALDTDETKNAVYDPEFCQGNSGSPLMCEGEVMGLQTYIENNCKQPHLYQLLSSWDTLISCASQDKCEQDYCLNICSVTNKDPPVVAHTIVPPSQTNTIPLSTHEMTESSESTIDTTTGVTPHVESQQPTEEIESTSAPVSADTSETQTTSSTSTSESTTESTITAEIETTTATVPGASESTILSWPNERSTDWNGRKQGDGNEEAASVEREPKVEAQLNQATKKTRSAAYRNISLIQSIVLCVFVLICVI